MSLPSVTKFALAIESLEKQQLVLKNLGNAKKSKL